MRIIFNKLASLTAMCILMLVLSACSEKPEKITAPEAPVKTSVDNTAAEKLVANGQGYELVKTPQQVPDDGNLYVEEFFWYACIHCYHLEPALEAWHQRQPKDVQLVRVPAILNINWGSYAHVYYVMKGFNLVEKAHMDMFEQIHKYNKDMTQMPELTAFFAKYGIDENQVKMAFDPENPSIKAALLQAVERISAFEISSVPTLVVNGKYKVSAKTAEGADNIFNVVDALIKKERLTR